MAKPLVLTLNSQERQELEHARDRHKLAYIRERAAALLKIADGQSGRRVAEQGLLKTRKADTLYEWVRRFRADGFKGLLIQPGRGRKPAYTPQHADALSAQTALLHVVRRDPQQFGHAQSRWTLSTIAQSCPWLRLTTLGGLARLLDRLDIHYKRARAYVHSPDRYYEAKLALIQRCLLRAWYDPEHYVFLYQDELTYYRQPTLACAYEAVGHVQPLARRSWSSDQWFRVVAGLNAVTGQVTFQQHAKISLPHLGDFYEAATLTYPGKFIYIAQDNWPIHFHPDVLVRLQPQNLPWPPKLPANWPTEPSPKARRTNLPIQLLCLPTYASWCNPIEKLWRWLQQDILHLHQNSDAWPELRQRVAKFLTGFSTDSPELLRYVGLLPD
jgi:transposase